MPAVVPLILVAVSAAGSVAGAKIAANASRDAAATQEKSGNQALALQKQQYDAQMKRQQPYVDAGTEALRQLQQRQAAPPMQMPMFNGNQQGGGWTPENYAAQLPTNRYAQMWNAPPPAPGMRPPTGPIARPFGGGQ
jgi:Flp pilus assembly protein TadB